MNNFLVDINTIFFKDLLIIKNFCNQYKSITIDGYLRESIINNSDSNIIYQLLTRTERNPLSILFNNTDNIDLDSILNEFINSNYEKLLSKDTRTDVYTFIHNVYETLKLDFSISILVNNEIERDFIIKNTPFKTTMINDDISRFNYFIFDNIEDIEEDRLFDSVYFISNTGYNLYYNKETKKYSIPEKYSKYMGIVININIIDLFKITPDFLVYG